MEYYCNICKKGITKAEFLYSIDNFDRPLCREHQDLERKIQDTDFQHDTQKSHIMEKEDIEIINLETKRPKEEILEDTSKGGWKSFVKKVAVGTGKGIVKGVKKIADTSKKTMQIRKWKDEILRRMDMSQLKHLCFEKKISIKKQVLEEDGKSIDLFWKEYDCTKDELISRIKNKVSLDDIISYVKRSHINIRDILTDIDTKKAEWDVKELSEKIDEIGSNLFLELEKAIREFRPLRNYDQEIFFQDSLASFLKSKFSDTEIEVPRGSTRPDIVVEGIAIEVKGPTYDKDLQTIADKCLRYRQYFPKGMICVLFKVNVNQYRYEDWLRGMKQNYPDVLIIKV